MLASDANTDAAELYIDSHSRRIRTLSPENSNIRHSCWGHVTCTERKVMASPLHHGAGREGQLTGRPPCKHSGDHMWSSLSSSTQREGGRGSFDEDVFSGTEDAHVFSVVLLERPPVVGQRTDFSQVSGGRNLHVSSDVLVAWTLTGTACPSLPVFPLMHAGLQPLCSSYMNTFLGA